MELTKFLESRLVTVAIDNFILQFFSLSDLLLKRSVPRITLLSSIGLEGVFLAMGLANKFIETVFRDILNLSLAVVEKRCISWTVVL